MWLSDFDLANRLRSYGLTVIETTNWDKRGYAGQPMQGVYGDAWHHTATNRAAFLFSGSPTLGLVMNGRSDLAGPLCHILFAREGEVILVAAGVANHAGSGKWTGIDWHQGNRQSIGIEMESSGIAPFDWTPQQLAVAPVLGRALQEIFNHKNDFAHYEYSDAGKIDPAGWPGKMDGLRAAIDNTNLEEELAGMNTDQNNALAEAWQNSKDIEAAVNNLVTAISLIGTLPGVVFVRGDKSDTVYAWDASTGYRPLSYAEWAPLSASGAVTHKVPQEKIDAAIAEAKALKETAK